MPASCDAVSPIRRPRAFARALGAMVAEQAGPRSRIVLLRSTVEGRSFRTAHKSQTVYHGPVVYLDDPVRRLEGASSELELSLLLVFLKDVARRAEREYQFAVWAEDEPAEAVLDLDVSPALVDAVLRAGCQGASGGGRRAGFPALSREHTPTPGVIPTPTTMASVVSGSRDRVRRAAVGALAGRTEMSPATRVRTCPFSGGAMIADLLTCLLTFGARKGLLGWFLTGAGPIRTAANGDPDVTWSRGCGQRP